MQSSGSLPWEAALGSPPDGLSDTEMRSLTGNAMHLAALGSVLLFALCSLQKFEDCSPMLYRHMNSVLEESESEDIQ